MARSEPAPSQRGLVGRRLRLADREVVTKYVFLFAEPAWTVAFASVDILGVGPRIHTGPLVHGREGLASEARFADLRAVEDIPRERFDDLVHFDPWWAFRGIGGVDRPWIDAILASNIAKPFEHGGTTLKVHDLAFRGDLASLEAVVAKDPAFRTRSFRMGEIDLPRLRRPAKTL